MKKVVLAAAVLAAACHSPRSGLASPWVPIVNSPQITVLVDTSRLSKIEQVTRLWLRFEYAVPQPKLKSTRGPYASSEVQEEVNCQQQQARDLQLRLLGADGQVVGDTVFAASSWTTFAAHPLTPSILGPLCSQIGKGRGAER
jgi:hypothetical protein